LVRQFAAKTLLARKHWKGISGVLGRFAIRAWGLNRLIETTVLGCFNDEKRRERDIWRRVWRRRGDWA
jgi:hypothetical protein